MKKVFWTHKFAVRPIDMGNMSHRTHMPKIVNKSLHPTDFSQISALDSALKMSPGAI